MNFKTIIYKIFALTIVAVFLLTTDSFAGDKDPGEWHSLESITVIATKTPKASLDSPASVSIITEDEIDAFISEHPFKPLARTEGVWPRQYRGLADYWARPVFRGHRALVMVDGLSWYDYGYYYHTGAIPMADVERIDVARGPFSALYGTLAQTAVINYITTVPEELEIKASASYGDGNSRFYSMRIADRPFRNSKEDAKFRWANNVLGNRFFYSFSFKSRTSDGYTTTPSYKSLTTPVTGPLDSDIPVATGWSKDLDPQSGKSRFEIGDQGDNWYEDYCLFSKTGYDFSPDTRLWYSLNISEFEYGWEDGKSYLKDSSGTTINEGDVYIQDAGNTYNYSLNPFLFTSDDKRKKSIAHTINFNHSVPGLVDIVAVLGFNDKESSTHYVSKSRYKIEDNYLAQADIAATFHFFDDKYLITAGVQGIQEKADVKDKNLSDCYNENSTTSIREETTGRNRTMGTFIQMEYSPVDYLTAYAGGRYDHWWGDNAKYSNINGEHIKHPDVDDGKFSPKLSLVYRIMENGSIRASYGEAFTAPSLYYRTASYYWESAGSISMAKPNPSLDPTTNKTWEIGTEWELWEKRIKVKATYFENDFKDLIINKKTTYTLANGTEIIEKQRINAEEAEVNGIETAVEALLPCRMKAGIFYTHNWSKYTKTDDPSKKGWQVDETPENIWNLWFGYFGEYLDASMSYRYCDNRFDDDKNSYADDTYKGDDDYDIVDAKVTFRPAEHVAFSVGVENLFDEKYYEYYRAPGRFWLSTLTVNF